MILNAKTQRRKGMSATDLRYMCGHPRGTMKALCVFVWFAASVAVSADSSARTAEQWKLDAEARLRAGEKRQAAEAYEQAVRLEPSARVQLAPVLAGLYAETKTSDKALGWAKVAMERSPDPQAYLAGIYLKLGQPAQAQSILVRELGKTNAPPRALSLNWQLADLQLHQGDTNAALATLQKAAQAVRGTPDAPRAETHYQKLKLNSEPYRDPR